MHQNKEEHQILTNFELENRNVEDEDAVNRNTKGGAKLKSKVQLYFDDLVSNSTLHGIHFCFGKRHLVSRIFWIILVTTASALFAFMFNRILDDYFKYPFFTATRTHHVDELTFPAVSICNVNDIRSSHINGSIESLLADAKNIDVLLTGEGNHEIKSMLYSCNFDRFKSCTHEDFQPFFRDGLFKCFTLKSGKDPEKVIKSTRLTKLYPLSLKLNVEHFEYHDIDHVGIRLILHPQGEIPFKRVGYLLRPGTNTHIEVKKQKVKYLGKPYDSECGEEKLQYFENYSQGHCILEHETNWVTKKCGCKSVEMPGIFRICTFNESLSCLWPQIVKFWEASKGICPLPCEREVYTSTVSSSLYPSNKVADMFAKSKNLNGTVKENREWIRENFLKVQITYEEMAYESVEHIPKYNDAQILALIGGIAALFLGSSILTCMEFVDFAARVIFAVVQKYLKIKH